jgi:hypothetical protein
MRIFMNKSLVQFHRVVENGRGQGFEPPTGLTQVEQQYPVDVSQLFGLLTNLVRDSRSVFAEQPTCSKISTKSSKLRLSMNEGIRSINSSSCRLE